MKKLANILRLELVLSGATIILLIAVILFKKNSDMSDMTSLMLVVGLFVAHAVYASFVWRENPADEREEMQTLLSNKVAYLTGATVLTIATGVQLKQHDLDIWIPITLGLMVLSKSVTLYLAKKREK